MSHIIFPIAIIFILAVFIFVVVGPDNLTFAMKFIVDEVAVETPFTSRVGRGLVLLTGSISEPITEGTDVPGAVGIHLLVLTIAVVFTILKLTNIVIVIGPSLLSLTLNDVVHEGSLVLMAVVENVQSEAILLVVFPCADVEVAGFCTKELSRAVCSVIFPPAFVYRTVCLDELASALTHILTSKPFSIICLTRIRQFYRWPLLNTSSHPIVN